MKKTTRTVVVLTALFVAAATGYSQQNIHGAAVDVNLADTELYLQKGADVNAKDNNGITPLKVATAAVAEVLKQHGAKK